MHVLTTQATALPVKLDDCKAYSYITGNEDDSLLQSLILEATQFLENRFRCAIMTQTWQQVQDGFFDARYWIGNAIQIARPPFLAVSSITYQDQNGDSQTLAASQYRVVAQGIYARIVQAKNVTWPTTREVIGDVTITHTCGYSSQAAVPYSIRQAVKDYVDNAYNHRGAGMRTEFLVQIDAEMGSQGAVGYA